LALALPYSIFVNEQTSGDRKDWYVVYSKPHKEEQAQLHLRSKGLDAFFPRLHLPGAAANKKKRIISLFPNYLFVRMHFDTEYHYVTWTPGIKRIVSFNDSPIPLKDEVVQFLMRQAGPEGLITARSALEPGQQVEIDGGPFDGLMGIIQEPPNDKGRVKVLLKLLSRHIKVELRVQFIKDESAAYRPAAVPQIGRDFLAA
jgi:transcription elongation factor/antiterminator RfaH